MRAQSDPEVTQENLATLPQQQVGRFHIAVSQAYAVHILQGLSHLLYVLHDGRNREPLPTGVSLAQRTTGRLLHYKIGHLLLDSIVQQTNDMWVRETNEGLSLSLKPGGCFRSQWCGEYFDGGLTL